MKSLTIAVLVVCCFAQLVLSSEESQDKQCPENEEYLPCGPSCQRLCPTLNQPCYIAHFRCPDGCYCVKGYARVKNGGKCIPIDQCGKSG